MNKLEEYRDKKSNEELEFGLSNPEFTSEEILAYRNTLKSYYRFGFDAAIALDLPVKFADWYQSINKMGHDTRVKIVKELNLDCYPTIKDFYQYWIDNIYKPE